jgi:hypothetical protein
MKKLLYTFIAISFATTILAQDDSKSVRFGVFVRGTPTWYSMSTNNNYSKGGAIFGMGFGLNLEFRLTDVVAFQTGVGGDFDGGKINYGTAGSSPANNYYTGCILDKTPAFVDITGHSFGDFSATQNTSIYLKSTRQIHTTYVTIPLILKMKTKEISGFKYFVDFGGTVGVLASAKADDSYTLLPNGLGGEGSFKGFSMYKDCNPVRVGLNVGGGAEYRLAGTTSVFLSVNFVNSFISTVKSTSIYNFTNVDYSGNSKGTFTYAAQNFKTNGVQINIGILF